MQLRLTRLRAINCLSYQKLDIRLSSEGLVLLVGKNGSGKSNIIEIILYTLFDKTLKSGTADHVVRRSALLRGKSMTVQLDFRVGKSSYSIRKTRGRGASTLVLKKDGMDVSAHRAADTKKLIQETIGITFNEFLSRVALPSRAMHPLTIGTQSSRAEYISRTYNLDEFDVLKARLLERRKLYGVQDVSAYREELTELQKELEGIPTSGVLKTELQEHERQRSLLKGELAKCDSEIILLVRKQEGQERRLRLLKTIGEAPNVDIKALRADIRKQREQELATRELWRGLTRREKITQAHSKEPPKPKGIKQAQERADELDLALLAERSKAEVVCEACKRAMQKVTCGSCHKEVSIAPSPERLRRLKNERETHQCVLSELEMQAARYAKFVYEKAAYDKELSELPSGNLKETRKKLARLGAQIEEAENRLRVEIKNQALREEMLELPKGNPALTERLVEKRTGEVARIRRQQDALSSLVAKIKQQIVRRAGISEKILRIESLLQEKQKQEKLVTVIDDAVTAFGSKEIKLEAMRSVLDHLSTEMSVYTKSLLPSYEFTITPNENSVGFNYIDEHGVASDISSLSEGERKRLSIALLLAERGSGSVHSNVLILDEFDWGLDPEGRGEFLEILQDLTRLYPTIIAVSHLPDVQESGIFDKFLRVRRRGGVSRLEDPSQTKE